MESDEAAEFEAGAQAARTSTKLTGTTRCARRGLAAARRFQTFNATARIPADGFLPSIVCTPLASPDCKRDIVTRAIEHRRFPPPKRA